VSGFLSRKSFTLIEMLVVVTIIGILLAIILPAVTSARERGRTVRCAGNLKELHTAALNYSFRNADSYYGDKRLPRSRSEEWKDVERDRWVSHVGWVDWYFHQRNSGGNKGYTKWWGSGAYKSLSSTNCGENEDGERSHTLWEYTGKNLRVYVCPTFNKADIAGANAPAPDAGTKLLFDYDKTRGVLRSYGMNSLVSGVQPGQNAQIPNETKWVVVGARTILFADLSEKTSFDGTPMAQRCLKTAAGDDSYPSCYQFDGELRAEKWGNYCIEAVGSYHSGKGNAVFVDGHVEAILPKDTFKACTADW